MGLFGFGGDRHTIRSLPYIAEELQRIRQKELPRMIAIYKSSFFIEFLTLGFLLVVDYVCRVTCLPRLVRPLLRRHWIEANARRILKRGGIGLDDRQTSGVRIPAIYDDDNYGLQLGEVDYCGKTVLDIGADVGSTADFFLRRGAKLVIAVEGSRAFFERLKANARILNGILPVYLYIDRASQVEWLILQRNYDLLKMDIYDGDEISLLQISDLIFKRIPEYIVEVHSEDLFNMLVKKCAKNNYEMKVHTWRPSSTDSGRLRIVYARRMRGYLPEKTNERCLGTGHWNQSSTSTLS
jgi:hypothetical protein